MIKGKPCNHRYVLVRIRRSKHVRTCYRPTSLTYLGTLASPFVPPFLIILNAEPRDVWRRIILGLKSWQLSDNDRLLALITVREYCLHYLVLSCNVLIHGPLTSLGEISDLVRDLHATTLYRHRIQLSLALEVTPPIKVLWISWGDRVLIGCVLDCWIEIL